MKLYLVRHAEAEEVRDASPRSDAARALTPKGRRKTRSLAHALRTLEVSWDLLWTSPLTRARQTADILARGLRLTRTPVVVESLLPDRDPQEVVAELAALRPLPDAMGLVGHEPHLGHLVALLCTGAPDGAEFDFKKCGLCRLDVEKIRPGRCAQLEWFIPPRWFAPD